MCDDYDTDLDSEPDDFEKEKLIDDIERIQLALAESDAEEPSEDDDDEEENTDFIETSSFRYNRSNVPPSNSQETNENTNILSTKNDISLELTPSNCKTSQEDEVDPETKGTLTELVPMTTDVLETEPNQEIVGGFHGHLAPQIASLNVKDQSVISTDQLFSDEPGPSGCHSNLLPAVEHSDNLATINITNKDEYNQENDAHGNTLPVVMTTADQTSSITDELALYNFAQQGIAGYNEDPQEGIVEDNHTNEIVIDVEGINDIIDVKSLGLKDAIVWSLARNREYQSQILNELCNIELALEDNKRKQLSLSQIQMKEEEEIQQALPSLVKFSFPYFRDSDGHGPPDNEDAKHIRGLVGTGAYQTKSKAWNAKEEKLLAEGVRMQNFKNKLSPLLSSLKEAQSQPVIDPVKVALLNKQIKEVKELSPKSLEQDLDGLDWDRLCTEYLPKRRAIECKLHWCHFGHPRVNRKPWTKHEDKMLLKLAKDKDHVDVNWNTIAQTIQTNRTPLQCYQRFQRSLNKEILRSKWTPEEDEQLTELVKTFGEGNWQRIADYLDGRMGEQCMHRYMKACKPARKGKWSDDENEKLQEAVRIVGHLNWEKVAEYVPGRTGTQCRERFVNVLDPNLIKGPWEKDEDQKLLDLVEQHGEGCWSKISKEIATRTDNQCWRRWIILRKADYLHYRVNTLRKKREMVANFVGRRKEKPSLQPEDLDIQDIPITLPKRPQPKTDSQSKPKAKKRNKKKNVKTEKIEKCTEDSTTNNENQDASSEPRDATPCTSKDNNVPVHKNDHNYAKDSFTSTKDPNDTLPSGSSHVTSGDGDQSSSGILGSHAMCATKRTMSESSTSDEEWNDNITIDLTELGNRTSTRKRKKVTYTIDDDFISDISEDEDEDEEDTTQQQPKQVKHINVKSNESLVENRADKKAENSRTSGKTVAKAVPNVQNANTGNKTTAGATVNVQNASATGNKAAGTKPTTGAAGKQQSPVKVQGSVASFSLLLQAFNINVSGVLNKVKPTTTQHASQASSPRATGSNQLGKVPNPASTSQQLFLAPVTPNKGNSSSQSSKKSETTRKSSRRLPTVFVTPNKDNFSSQSSEECEATKTTSQRLHTVSVSPNKVTSSAQSPKRSQTTSTPSKRKATTPRRTRRKTSQVPSPVNLSNRIENVIQENEKLLASSNLQKSVPQNKNKGQGDTTKKGNANKRQSVPSIPPLPPCLTTLKGLKNLLGMKEQLEKLAQNVNTNVAITPSRNTSASVSNTTSNVVPITRGKNTDSERSTPKSTSGAVATETSNTANTSPRKSVASGFTERQNETPETSLLLSRSSTDSGYSQSPFVRYFPYRKTPEYNLLNGRFNSLFLWPMLMSKVPLVGKVPKDLFRVSRRQQTWGFPQMFSLPGAAPLASVDNQRTGTFNPLSTSTPTSSKIPVDLSSVETRRMSQRNPRKRPAFDEDFVPKKERSKRVNYAEEKNVERKRPAFDEDFVPKKKRSERVDYTEDKNDESEKTSDSNETDEPKRQRRAKFFSTTTKNAIADSDQATRSSRKRTSAKTSPPNTKKRKETESDTSAFEDESIDEGSRVILTNVICVSSEIPAELNVTPVFGEREAARRKRRKGTPSKSVLSNDTQCSSAVEDAASISDVPET